MAIAVGAIRFVPVDRDTDIDGSPLYFARDESESGDAVYIVADWRVENDPKINRGIVTAHYFPDDALSFEAQRAAIGTYVDEIKAAITFRPPVQKDAARGRMLLPNIFNNFGRVEAESDQTAATILMENCVLADARVVDDSGVGGITLEFEFWNVSTSASA